MTPPWKSQKAGKAQLPLSASQQLSELRSPVEPTAQPMGCSHLQSGTQGSGAWGTVSPSTEHPGTLLTDVHSRVRSCVCTGHSSLQAACRAACCYCYFLITSLAGNRPPTMSKGSWGLNPDNLTVWSWSQSSSVP